MTFREEIDAPVERVFDALTQLEHAHDWMPNLVSVEKLTPGAFGVGTRWRETRKVFGKAASEEFEVTALEPNRRLDLFVDGRKGSSKRGEYRFRYDLEPMASRTVLTMNGEISGMGAVMEVLGRLFMGMFKKMIAKDLHAMRAYAERGAAA